MFRSISLVRYVGRSEPRSKPILLYVRLSLRPLSQQAHHVWLKELLRYLWSNSSSRLFTFLYPIGYQSAQFFRRALHYASGGRKFLHQSAQPLWGSLSLVISLKMMYIYIYIYTSSLKILLEKCIPAKMAVASSLGSTHDSLIVTILVLAVYFNQYIEKAPLVGQPEKKRQKRNTKNY